MSDSVFGKYPKPGDSFYFSVGKASTTIPLGIPNYQKIHKTLTEIKNCTDIFDRYEVDLQGKCLTNWKTKDLDLFLCSKGYNDVSIDFKDIDLNVLEDDLSIISEIGFKHKLLIDTSYFSRRNLEPREMSYDYIINHPVYKKYENEDIPKSLKLFFHHAFIGDEDLFTIRPSPIIKRINQEVSAKITKGIEISNFLRLRLYSTDTNEILILGMKILNRIYKNPTKNIVIKFDANEFLNISEEEFKERTNHNKDLTI